MHSGTEGKNVHNKQLRRNRTDFELRLSREKRQNKCEIRRASFLATKEGM